MNLQRIYGENIPPFPLTYINDIAEAIIRVDEKYCHWIYNQRTNPNQMTERVFAYELFHQFRQITNSNPDYFELRFDGEIDKLLHGDTVEVCGIKEDVNLDINSTQTYFSPDLVIHHSQNDRTCCNQKAIIEIKTGYVSDSELAKTIIKLNHYIRVLHFQYAVFITVNTDFIRIVEGLKRSLNSPATKDLKERFNQIIIMNYDDRKLTEDTLLNILIN